MVYVSIFWWIPLFPTHSCRWERAGSDLHVNEVNENSARLESFCAVPTKVIPSSPRSRFLLNLTQISRESICESSITLFKAASHFVLRLPWMRILGVGGLGGRGLEVDRGALWEAAAIIIIRARPMEALALLPKDDGQGPCDYPPTKL